jgi:hypothetical protein
MDQIRGQFQYRFTVPGRGPVPPVGAGADPDAALAAGFR